MQAQLESLHVQVVVPESGGAGSLSKKLADSDDGEREDGATAAAASPVAFPMLPIDRYGFLITDKCDS